ncbi:DgyrCDS136 [Dimorphilus gyrociliatus]|uniref:DgyrCDS136 n=1 Tax=Dimorphilus gyrociliatus TaxID=2664684 RepID=A0A7I8V579_9ANNE|nr:DgyrCDS136 [Dimorphilus gyrociliatus]
MSTPHLSFGSGGLYGANTSSTVSNLTASFQRPISASNQFGRPVTPTSPSSQLSQGVLNSPVRTPRQMPSVVPAPQLNVNKRPLGPQANFLNSSGPSLPSVFPRSQSQLDQPNLDLSEFPSLGRSSSLSSAISTPRNYVSMVNKQSQETSSEFQIQNEDFPALPGSTPSTQTTVIDGRPSSTGSVMNQTTIVNRETSRQTDDKKGIQTSRDGIVSNIPSNMVTDQFGIVGLLTFIRAAENDQSLVALAPGIDLTTLGLNLNAPDNLYPTFLSPWADGPCRPQDIDYHVPTEYLTNMYIREKLAPIKLNRYGEDLLFFQFYMYGGDLMQIGAAAELYHRDWRYHKEEKVWITRVQGVDPSYKSSTYERGTYYVFDVSTWRKVAKDMTIEYDKLDERPVMPHPQT